MKTKVSGLCAALAATLAAAPAAAASLDLGHDIQARGANPEWSLRVQRGVEFTLTRKGKPALHATAPGAAISSGGASWSAKSADGQLLKVNLQTRACNLGSKQYPMTAQVALGAETLSGCAGPSH